MKDNYVVYHLHSDLSNGVTSIDSVTKPDQYIEKAKECGMQALAFSEHGSIFSWIKKKEHIEAAGMKYIHAEEFYVTKTLDEKIRDNRHCVLIARNYEGVLELNKLSSISFNRQDNHYYYVPRITVDELCHTSDNIIVTTACLGGVLLGEDRETRRAILDFVIKNKHRCFLEIQHHMVEEQIKYNKSLYKVSQKYGIPLICGTDTHALNAEHMEARSILQKAKNISFPEEDDWDLTFKTYDELIAAYEKQNSLPMNVVREAIENTNRMADMVEEFELDRSYKYPHLWKDSEKVLVQKIKQGIKTRGVDSYPNREEYAERIKYEMKAYKHNQAIDFLLLMEDIVSWCRTQDIQIGYGRGSVNGSVIAWLLGITEMDSIKHKLNFDRFMNVERVSLSDVDTDFPPSRIDDVKQYIFNKHGLYCCDIATFNTVADKGAIRDVGRALEMPLSEVSDICDTVDDEEKYEKTREQYPELFKYVDLIKGVVVSCGNHPCGDVVAPYSIDDRMGTFTTSTDAYPISQIYMKEIDGLNYVKLDLLKLDTIELIAETCKIIGIPMLTPDNMDISDVNVWNSMRDDTTQIFQWEGDTGESYIKKLLSDDNIEKFKAIDKNVDRMALLSIGNSAIRPAGASYREDLAKGVVRKSGSDAIDDFLKPTFGYLVYQCQIIEFLHSYCGFTMGEADIVRRHFAKKTGTENDIPIIKDGGYMTDEKKHYIPGFVATMKDKYGMTKEEAEETIIAFLRVIEDASSYLFSVNHSTPYSYEGYACGWLRYHYPVEFLTCALNINADNEEKTTAISAYARKVGIRIESIRFRHSIGDYSCDAQNRVIYKGLSSIKFMSDAAANDLNKLKNNEYDSFVEFLIDLKNTSINSRQLEILIKLNYFNEFGDITTLLKTAELVGLLYGKKQLTPEKCEKNNIPVWIVDKHAQKKTEKQFRDFDSVALIKDIVEHSNLQKTPVIKKVGYEFEYLGYSTITDPRFDEEHWYVVDVLGAYKNMLSLYNLKYGTYRTIKYKKDKYGNQPEKGNTIKVIEYTERNKMKPDGVDENGKKKFITLDEREIVVSKFKIIG